MFLFLIAGNVYALKISNIVDYPISYNDLAVINHMIKKHKRFSEADLRNLLRNYTGFSIGRRIKSNTMNTLTNLMTGGNSPHTICAKYIYFMQNDKIMKKKITPQPICYSFYKETIVANNSNNYRYAHLIHTHVKHSKALAITVYKALMAYPNLINNINAQGRHWQNALWITADRGFTHALFVILKYAPKVNPNITGISMYARQFCSIAHSGSVAVYNCSIPYNLKLHKLVEYQSYACIDEFGASSGFGIGTWDAGLQTRPYYILNILHYFKALTSKIAFIDELMMLKKMKFYYCYMSKRQIDKMLK